METRIEKEIKKFIKEYTEMDIMGLRINCPYWANKIKGGKVYLRGFVNGKGMAEEIRRELVKRLNEKFLKEKVRPKFTSDWLHKFARREKIGIDCSGFVYRTLEKLVELNYGRSSVSILSQVFKGGINRTNAAMLTSLDYCFPIKEIKDIRLGDLIRFRSGRHVAIIVGRNYQKIVYAHSSFFTEIRGVHTAVIRILDMKKSLEEQIWEEKTNTGGSFQEKYFNVKKGDGVYRLKIFSQNG